MSDNSHHNPPPTCPYCGEATRKLPAHLPCDATPTTEELYE